MEKMGDLVKRRREELGLSQEDLARLLAYKHKTSINKIEMGKSGIPRAKLPDFARVLGVDIAALAEWDEDRKTVSAEYCVEQLAHLIGWDLISDAEGNVILLHQGKEYELEEGDVEQLQEDLVVYLQFLLERISVRRAR